jgi:hypothetical protein
MQYISEEDTGRGRDLFTRVLVGLPRRSHPTTVVAVPREVLLLLLLLMLEEGEEEAIVEGVYAVANTVGLIPTIDVTALPSPNPKTVERVLYGVLLLYKDEENVV